MATKQQLEKVAQGYGCTVEYEPDGVSIEAPKGKLWAIEGTNYVLVCQQGDESMSDVYDQAISDMECGVYDA